jgi:hypothetical protein
MEQTRDRLRWRTDWRTTRQGPAADAGLVATGLSGRNLDEE